MLSLRQTSLRYLMVFAVLLTLDEALGFAQSPTNGIYTYRYGYNPGYYGSSAPPQDFASKPGQITSGSGGYWYIKLPGAPSPPTSQPLQFYICVTQ